LGLAVFHNYPDEVFGEIYFSKKCVPNIEQKMVLSLLRNLHYSFSMPELFPFAEENTCHLPVCKI